MNKTILVSALVIALSASIKAQLDDPQAKACVEKLWRRSENIEVPERVERVAEIVLKYQPGNPSIGYILDNHRIDTRKFYRRQSDLVGLQFVAIEFAADLFDTLGGETCLQNTKYQEYLKRLEQDGSNPGRARVQKINDYLRLCTEIRYIGEGWDL